MTSAAAETRRIAELANRQLENGNRALRRIIAHANRHSAERIADVIDTLELYGNPNEDIEETAVGYYVADRLLAEGLAPAIYVINTGSKITAINSRTRAVIAEMSIEGSTLQEVHYLIEEGVDGFAHLNQDEPEPHGPYDGHSEIVRGPVADTAPEFLDCVTSFTVIDF